MSSNTVHTRITKPTHTRVNTGWLYTPRPESEHQSRCTTVAPSLIHIEPEALIYRVSTGFSWKYVISLLVRKIFPSLKLVQSHGIVSVSDEIFFWVVHMSFRDWWWWWGGGVKIVVWHCIGDAYVLYWWFGAVRIFGRSKSCLYRTWSAKRSRTFRIRCPRDGMRNVRWYFIYDMYMKMRSKTWSAKCSRRRFRRPCLQKNFFQFFFENVFYIMKKNDVFWKFFFFT